MFHGFLEGWSSRGGGGERAEEFRQIASHYQYTHNVNHCGNDNEIATTFYTDIEPVGRPLPAFGHPPRRGEGQGNPSWRLATDCNDLALAPLSS